MNLNSKKLTKSVVKVLMSGRTRSALLSCRLLNQRTPTKSKVKPLKKFTRSTKSEQEIVKKTIISL